MNYVKIKLKKDIAGHKAGEVIKLETSKNSTVLSSFWRRRIKDSEIDGCVQVIGQTKKQSNPDPKLEEPEDKKDKKEKGAK